MALVKLDDDLVARYAASLKDPSLPVAPILDAQLARTAAFPPPTPILILDRAHLQPLETLLGGGLIRSADDLVARVRTYASITLGKIVLDLTPAQKEELAYRAQKQGRSPDALVADLVAQVTEAMFWGATPTR